MPSYQEYIQKSAQSTLDEYNKLVETIKKECIQIGDLLKEEDLKMEHCKHWIAFWKTLIFGSGTTSKCVTWNIIHEAINNSFQISVAHADDFLAAGARTGTTAFKALGSTAARSGHVVGGVEGLLFIALDIKTLVSSAMVLLKNKPHKVSKQIRSTKEAVDIMIEKTFK
ncbi:Hypothetical predicted protein [Mytilus galloprovincialis]|uniref:Uncharacterized protein n=1 Tax=Mytilus galloprovincialis TaxID=29158 RepID=A0A8B6BY84_MYTGA|nr:Hypothetical predicted protein [Mytilus galloprovincialis]